MELIVGILIRGYGAFHLKKLRSLKTLSKRFGNDNRIYNMNFKTQEENPEGFYRKYKIQKYKGKKYVGDNFFNVPLFEPYYEDVDDNSEYFVLRLDDNVSDKNHLAACRKAILTYAENIRSFTPKLAEDLIEKYGKTQLK